VRRGAPRRIALALDAVVAQSTPQTPLARVQAVWNDTVGATIAAEAQPVSEREGTLTVACRSAVWASELELLAPDLLERLNGALGGGAARPLTALRARVGGLP